MKYPEQENLQRQKVDYIVVDLGWGNVGELGVTAKCCSVSFQGSENILKLIVVMDAQLWDYIKSH